LADTAGNCNGGDFLMAYEFIYNHTITDETCMPYEGVDFSIWAEVNILKNIYFKRNNKK
jgi:hypothetical protein